MTSSLATTLSYIPHSLLSLLLVRGQVTNEPMQYEFEAAVLFADVSGFTPLSEALGQKGDEGPEEITRLLNRYFGRMIAILEEQGGDVVKFGGDALTVLFAVEDEPLGYAVRRALQAAHQMQSVMTELAPVETSVGPVELGLKVGIGAGVVRALQVGGVFRRWEYVINGPALQQAADAEGLANRGDICLSPEASSQCFQEELTPRSLSSRSGPSRDELLAMEAKLQRFLPGAVRSWIEHEELHSWLGVLRSMSVLFVGLSGIAYEEPEALHQLHTVLRGSQELVYRYQGSINKLAVDDKGTIALVLFGAPPFAHSDDPLRAVRCAMDLRDFVQDLGLTLRVGITTGRVFAGPVGSELRREYTAMGDAVNLAARLMGRCSPHGILCDVDTKNATSYAIAFDDLPPARLKGKSRPVPLFAPLSLLDTSDTSLEGDIMIGRCEELDFLQSKIESLLKGEASIVLIEGEGGIGKSLLLRQLALTLPEKNVQFVQGIGQSLEQLSHYWIWKEIVSQLFSLGELTDLEEKQARLTDWFATEVPALLPRLPLLSDVLGIPFSETEVSKTLDPSTRQQSLFDLVIEVLCHQSSRRPLCLAFDNLQWLDGLSWQLLLQFLRVLQSEEFPVLCILTTRPVGVQGLAYKQLQELRMASQVEFLLLQPINQESQLALIAALLSVSPLQVPKSLEALIKERAGGNPLFIGEFLTYLQGQQLLSVESDGDGKLLRLSPDLHHQAKRLPDTLEGLLLARLDQLSPAEQLVLKVSSVLGQSFSFSLLCDMVQKHTTLAKVSMQDRLEHVAQAGFLEPQIESSMLMYMFRLLASRDVVYRTLLHQQRRDIHRSVARWFEESFGEPHAEPEHSEQKLYDDSVKSSSLRSFGALDAVRVPGIYLGAVANHWMCAGDQLREQYYTKCAGWFAAEQFANAEGVELLSRALELTPDDCYDEKALLHLKCERLYGLLGERDAQRHEIGQLRSLCDQVSVPNLLRVQVALREAQWANATGAFSDAIRCAEEIVACIPEEEASWAHANALQQWGIAQLSSGEIDAAQERLERALFVAQTYHLPNEEASISRILGNCFAMRSSYDRALELYQQSFDVHEGAGDMPNAIKALNNIGLVYRSTQELGRSVGVFSDALERARTIGSLSLESLVIGNLASAFLAIGELQQAVDTLRRALLLSRRTGSPADECSTLVYLGEAWVRVGRYHEAIDALAKALERAREIGHPYMEAYALMYQSEAFVCAGMLDEAEATLALSGQFAERLSDPALAADVSFLLGHLGVARGEHQEAYALYDKARNGYVDLGTPAYAKEARAGMIYAGRANLSLESLASEAAVLLSEVNTGELTGFREPYWVLVRCLEVLRVAEEPGAMKVAEECVASLKARADTMGEELAKEYLARSHHRALCGLLELEWTHVVP